MFKYSYRPHLWHSLQNTKQLFHLQSMEIMLVEIKRKGKKIQKKKNTI